MRNSDSAEARFRLMAFQIAYDLYASTSCPAARFAKAIIHSSRPIHNRKMLEAWSDWTDRGRRSMQALLAEGRDPPEAIRPVIEAWRGAIARRAADTGETVEAITGYGKRRLA